MNDGKKRTSGGWKRKRVWGEDRADWEVWVESDGWWKILLIPKLFIISCHKIFQTIVETLLLYLEQLWVGGTRASKYERIRSKYLKTNFLALMMFVVEKELRKLSDVMLIICYTNIGNLDNWIYAWGSFKVWNSWAIILLSLKQIWNSGLMRMQRYKLSS